MVRISAVALATALVASSGCTQAPPPPTQKLTVVTAEIAPGLYAADRFQRLARPVFLGDVLLVSKPGPPGAWQGQLDGLDASRNGPTLDVRRTRSDRVIRVFASDVRQDVNVPDDSWICEQLAVLTEVPRCYSRLSRIVLGPERTLAYVPCSGRSCPVAMIEGGDIRVAAVEGLSEVRLVILTGQRVAIATSQWARSPTWTGRDLVVIDADHSFRRLAEIRVEEVQRHEDGFVDQRLGSVAFGLTEIRIEGTQQRVHNPTGRTVESSPLQENYCLTPDGSMQRCDAPQKPPRPAK